MDDGSTHDDGLSMRRFTLGLFSNLICLRHCVNIQLVVIIAADQSNGRSILTYQTNLDKIKELTTHSMMGVSGPNSDLVNFTE
jgi:hypothetical protein